MFKKLLAAKIAALLVVTLICSQSTPAESKAEKQARLAEKVKAGILKLGVGPDARVKLKLRDKSSVAGFISEARDDEFVVTNLKTAAATTVAYGAVTQVRGNNLSTRTKVIIGVAVIAAIAITLYLVRGAFCDGC
jgi:hypothetical protein